MSVRTIDEADFTLAGGLTGSASAAQINMALDVAWDWAEDEIGTHIIQTLVAQEIHLWPRGLRDWNEQRDRIYTEYHHVVSVSSVHVLEISDSCRCATTVLSGCALIVDADVGMLAVQQCASSAGANCGTCTSRPFQARINYTAGLFADNASIPGAVILAIVMKAREALLQITSGAVSSLGAKNITSWSSMDYSESRGGPSKNSSFIDDYIKRQLRKYKVLRAFSFRNTH